MIRPSPELLAVSRRWYAAILDRNAAAVQNLMSQQAHLRFVGTGPDELWTGHDVREMVGAFFDQVPEFLSSDEVLAEAFENGDTGWSCFVHHNRFATMPDEVREVRNTLIFALENGDWRIVQRHGSAPMDNTAFMGTEQIGIAALVAAARRDYPHSTGEGLSSIVFTDIVNSSHHAAAMGDGPWLRTISDHFDQLHRLIDANGGQLVKSLGDGTLSRFASARQALRAAKAIQRAMADARDGPKLSLRVGVHTGDVVQSQDDFFGTVVNKAARITTVADPGTILVSDATRAIVADDPDLVFDGGRALPLKGFAGDHIVYRLDWQP